jgi:hypothetical protein
MEQFLKTKLLPTSDNCVISFVEKDFLRTIPDDGIIVRFQGMDYRTHIVKL